MAPVDAENVPGLRWERDALMSATFTVEDRMQQIDARLELLEADFEEAALAAARAKRDRERLWAESYLSHEGTIAERKAHADLQVSEEREWAEVEGAWLGKKAVLSVLETRATIGATLLKAQKAMGG